MSSSVSTVTPSTRSTSSLDCSLSSTPHTTNDRISPFSIALLLLFVQSFAVILLSALPSSLPSGLLAIGMALFTYEWLIVHSSSLTRRRRPIFDEVNILQTYQPRARTMGHLFVPDPPTPAPNDDRPQRTKEERDAFTAARDAHYENQAIEAASKKAEIDRFLKASAESHELIPTSKRIDVSKMTIEEIIEKRRREKAETEKGKSSSKDEPSNSPKDNTDTCGVIKRENL